MASFPTTTVKPSPHFPGEQQTVTRSQLRGYGASDHLARAVTRSLEPVGQRGRSKCYGLRDVMQALRSYGERSRLRPSTRDTLSQILSALSPLLGNVATADFRLADDQDLGGAVAALLRSQQVTNQRLAEIGAITAEIKGRRPRR